MQRLRQGPRFWPRSHRPSATALWIRNARPCEKGFSLNFNGEQRARASRPILARFPQPRAWFKQPRGQDILYIFTWNKVLVHREANFPNRRLPTTSNPHLFFFFLFFSFFLSLLLVPLLSSAMLLPPIFHGSLQIHTILPARGLRERPRELCGFRLWQPETCPFHNDIPSLLCFRVSPPPSLVAPCPRSANFSYVQQFSAHREGTARQVASS